MLAGGFFSYNRPSEILLGVARASCVSVVATQFPFRQPSNDRPGIFTVNRHREPPTLKVPTCRRFLSWHRKNSWTSCHEERSPAPTSASRSGLCRAPRRRRVMQRLPSRPLDLAALREYPHQQLPFVRGLLAQALGEWLPRHAADPPGRPPLPRARARSAARRSENGVPFSRGAAALGLRSSSTLCLCTWTARQSSVSLRRRPRSVGWTAKATPAIHTF